MPRPIDPTRPAATARLGQPAAAAFVDAHGLHPDPAVRRRMTRRARAERIVRNGYRLDADVDADAVGLDRATTEALALRAAVDGVAIDWLAALLYGLDAARPDPRVAAVAVAPSCSGRRPGLRRLALEPGEVRVVGGVPCASPVRTLVAMGRRGPAGCEQALESALRLGLTDAQEIASALPGLGRRRVAHVGVLRQVLAARPPGVAPTESLLETLFVQLARSVPGLGPPVRQLELFDGQGSLVARLDLAWPELGLFVELDGRHHLGQPVYDANRETAVVALTGWLVGRFSWDEVVRTPVATARRLAMLVDQARRRPLPAAS